MTESEPNSDRFISVDASKIPTTADTSPATYFDPSDVDQDYWLSKTDWFRTKKESYFRHLSELHQGKKVVTGRYNTRYETHQMNKDLIEALSSQLNLTTSQRSKAKRRFLSFDLEEFGVNAKYVAYVLCQFIVHDDPADDRQCHPSCDTADVPEVFIKVRNSIKLYPALGDTLYGKIQHRFRDEPVREPPTHDEYGIRRLSSADHDSTERNSRVRGGGI